MPVLGPHGDQRRVNLSNHLNSEQRQAASFVLKNPIDLLSCSQWNNHSPWWVAERKVADNFCVFVIEGAVLLKLDGAEHVLKQGDCFLLATNQQHEFGLGPGVSECRHFVLHSLPRKQSLSNPLDSLVSPCHHIPYLMNEKEHLTNMVALYEAGIEEGIYFCHSFLQRIIIDLAIAGKIKTQDELPISPRLTLAISFINDNFNKPLSVAEIAESAGIHEVQCRKLFRKHMGNSPSEYLCRIRLRHAANLLTSTEEAVKSIAHICGFSNDRYFCFVFKKYFNTTPLDFRNERRYR